MTARPRPLCQQLDDDTLRARLHEGLMPVYEYALLLLRLYGQQTLMTNGKERPRWAESTMTKVNRLMKLYFFGEPGGPASQ